MSYLVLSINRLRIIANQFYTKKKAEIENGTDITFHGSIEAAYRDRRADISRCTCSACHLDLLSRRPLQSELQLKMF